MEALTIPIVKPVPEPSYHLKWFTNNGTEVRRTAQTWERAMKWFTTARQSSAGANHRQYSRDGGVTWTFF